MLPWQAVTALITRVSRLSRTTRVGRARNCSGVVASSGSGGSLNAHMAGDATAAEADVDAVGGIDGALHGVGIVRVGKDPLGRRRCQGRIEDVVEMRVNVAPEAQRIVERDQRAAVRRQVFVHVDDDEFA